MGKVKLTLSPEQVFTRKKYLKMRMRKITFGLVLISNTVVLNLLLLLGPGPLKVRIFAIDH